MLKKIPVLFFFLLVAIGSLAFSNKTLAQGISLIRDTEIENIIRDYSSPIFKAAGLEPDNVNIYLVNDPSLNAFVAGGQKLFLNTGLLLQSDSANQVIGVIAHEAGHISGGHLVRTRDALAKSSAQTILSMLIGGIAGAATGRGDVAGAIILGSQQSGQRSFLAYSRTQEGAADQAALKFLESSGQSAQGLLEFMERLGDQELLSTARQDPYVRSHPLSRDRVKAIQAFIKNSQFAKAEDSPERQLKHRRLRAKLYAYLNSRILTFRRYKKTDNSVPSRYARAVSLYRIGKISGALPLIDSLLADYPQDPYFHELRGQMLFENGRPSEALPSYKAALALLPDAPLIRVDTARVQLALEDPVQLPPAIKNLQISLDIEPDVPFTWRQLAIAYGRMGDKGHSALALGEEALLIRKMRAAKFHAGLAATLFPEGTPEWLQSQDILLAADELLKLEDN